MCLRLGIVHPDYLLQQLTARQLGEWEAYNTLQPIDGFREDWRFGMLASTITNLALSIHKKKGSTPAFTKATDFIPNWSGKEKSKKKQSTQEMKSLLLDFAKNHNDKLKSNTKRTKPPIKRRKR